MKMKTITSAQAADLAHTYHDAMVMVSRRSALGLSNGENPNRILTKYLRACEVAGVRLHNDAWEESAADVIDEILAKRKAAIKQLRASL